MKAIHAWILASILLLTTMFGYKLQDDNKYRLKARASASSVCDTFAPNYGKEMCAAMKEAASRDAVAQTVIFLYVPLALLAAAVGLGVFLSVRKPKQQ